jgi:hypothetical protein
MNTIGFLAFIFVGMTIVNRILEGQFITSVDVGIINNLVIFRPLDIGLFSIPVPNFSFITEGLPKLLTWDYSFFGGSAELISYLLYTVTAFIAFAVFLALIGVIAQAVGRLRA